MKFEISVKPSKYNRKVTLIAFSDDSLNLKIIAKELKKRLGTGGTVKGNVIILQGDQRKRIKTIEEVIHKHNTMTD